MEAEGNFPYSLWHHGRANTFRGELVKASAHCPHTEEGTLSWKGPEQELLQMVAGDENAFSPHLGRRSNIASSDLGFIFTAFVKQEGNFPSLKLCLISGKLSQYGSLKGESHAVVITSLFRKPLLNPSDLRIAFDATSSEIFDDTSAVSSEGGCCRCLRPFLTELSDLFNLNTSLAHLRRYLIIAEGNFTKLHTYPITLYATELQQDASRLFCSIQTETHLDSRKVKRQFVNLISTSFSSV